MTPEKEAEVCLMIKKVVKEAMAEERENFHIDRETHFRHHEFIENLSQLVSGTKSTIWRTVIRVFVWGGLIIFLFGLLTWFKLNLNDLPESITNLHKIGGK